MKYLKSIHIILFLFLCFSLQAEKAIVERVYVHLDKDCYVAGEDILVKLYVVDSNFQPSALSKVGYVEICDAEKPYVQLKLALEKGSGSGKISIPPHVPSGVYQLSGYTRYMRNEGENVFFSRQIAIINAGRPSDTSRVKRIDTGRPAVNRINPEPSNVKATTDRNEYSNREAVNLILENIPGNATDLVVSVSRNDSIASIPGVDKQAWLKQVTVVSPSPVSFNWLPECEGHIITGKLVPEIPAKDILPGIAFVGKDIRYQIGQINPDKTSICFYTSGIYGRQEVVSLVTSGVFGKVPYRMDIANPFCEILPKESPVLEVYPDNAQLADRYIGTQLKEVTGTDTLLYNDLPKDNIFRSTISYDLDEYRRFGTLSETFTEFIPRIKVSKVNGEKRMRVFNLETEQYSSGNTLVLLDGIPVFSHEDMLNYNPQHIRKVDIYEGRYVFNGQSFDAMVSFTTHQGNLPFFQLGEEAQLVEYDCPFLPVKFEAPDYSDSVVKNSIRPDYRHTLYWNPSVVPDHGRPVRMSFFTSDLSGEFKIVVEGITSDGKIIYGTSYFNVK